jgi:asparagine synthase (glutamine-hydrolysing)
MCGISGLYYFDSNRPVDNSLLVSMRERSAHRGPDDSGLYRNGNVGFAFNRLSIIDLSGGHQPMSNADGTVWIVFNGEIYNFKELQSALTRAGHRFRTRSDTETILKAWEEYGEDCVLHLRGMFAFAIWDERRRLLFAARDRLGIKPFYYYTDRERFAFASEIKSLVAIPEVPLQVNSVALADYLRHGYVVAPHTMFRQIRKLEPAHSITVDASGTKTRRYWDIPLEAPQDRTESEALEELTPLLDDIIRQHLVSDVPVGVFLSGGLDSSSIVALMSRLHLSGRKAFSIGYDSKESELGYARLVAKHCGAEYHEIVLSPLEFREALTNVAWHMDEPVADAPSVALNYLSKYARREVTVALGGDGADEVFGGYPAYNRMLMLDRINRAPFARLAGRVFETFAPAGKIRKNGAMLGRPLESRYRTALIFPLEEIAELLPDQPFLEDPYCSLAQAHARCRELPTLSRMSYVDLTTWMPDALLLKADRMSMAHSLELRVPFLDHKLVEFCARLPENLKIRRGTNKYLLKRVIKSQLPSPILNRSKKGFPIPIKTWFRGALADFVRDKLLATDSPCLSFFPRSQVARVLDAHSHRDCSDQIYALLVFDEWYSRFIREKQVLRETASVSK